MWDTLAWKQLPTCSTHGRCFRNAYSCRNAEVPLPSEEISFVWWPYHQFLYLPNRSCSTQNRNWVNRGREGSYLLSDPQHSGGRARHKDLDCALRVIPTEGRHCGLGLWLWSQTDGSQNCGSQLDPWGENHLASLCLGFLICQRNINKPHFAGLSVLSRETATQKLSETEGYYYLFENAPFSLAEMPWVEVFFSPSCIYSSNERK